MKPKRNCGLTDAKHCGIHVMNKVEMASPLVKNAKLNITSTALSDCNSVGKTLS
jgi:hypothetical protein